MSRHDDRDNRATWLVRAWLYVALVGAGVLIGGIIAAVLGWVAWLVGFHSTGTGLVLGAAWAVAAGTVVALVGALAAFVCSFQQVHRRRAGR